jgi:hypothetical protein
LREYEEILRLLFGFRPRIRPLDTVVPLLAEIVILVVLADEGGGGGLRAHSNDSKNSGLSYLGSSHKNLIKGSFIHSFLSYLLFHAFPSPVINIYATVLPPLLPLPTSMLQKLAKIHLI